MPVIVRALDMINKGPDKHVNKIPGIPSLYEIEKVSLSGTAYLLRRVRSIRLKISPKRG